MIADGQFPGATEMAERLREVDAALQNVNEHLAHAIAKVKGDDQLVCSGKYHVRAATEYAQTAFQKLALAMQDLPEPPEGTLEKAS